MFKQISFRLLIDTAFRSILLHNNKTLTLMKMIDSKFKKFILYRLYNSKLVQYKRASSAEFSIPVQVGGNCVARLPRKGGGAIVADFYLNPPSPISRLGSFGGAGKHPADCRRMRGFNLC